MRKLRIAVLIAMTAVSLSLLAWRWVTQRGLVTLSYTNAPLSSVIGSIEWQGMVEIRTNADLAMPVTMRLKRAPAFEAMETLAARIDANVRLAYIVAPSDAQIAELLHAFSSNASPEGWTVFAPGFIRGFFTGDAPFFDPRQIEWNVSENSDRNLQPMLDQGAQKTGAVFAAPADWNPVLSTFPSAGKVGKVTTHLLRAARGRAKEVFLLTISPPREDGPRQVESDRPRRNATVFPRRREPPENPQWAAERVQARIALLPEEDQPEARKQLDEMRAFWESIRGLPDEERLVKIEEQMSREDVQLRLEERAAERDARRTPEQREQRYRNYIRRKEQIKGSPAKS